MNIKAKNNIIKKFVVDNIRRNKKEYLILCIALFIGVVLGVLTINNIKEEEKNEVQNYINNFIQTIKSDSQIDKLSLLKETIIKNTTIGLLLWFIGSTVIGIPIIYLYIRI